MNPNGVVEAKGATAEAAAAPASSPPPNPFVGPVPLEEGQKLHGRRRETADLAALLVSKRIVLLFSPSGAGKTSLIRAGLMPLLLADYDIEALPVVRLGYRDEDCDKDPAINRYRVAMLYALEKRRAEKDRRPAGELCNYTLKQYFDEVLLPSMGRKGNDPNYPLLIIDQFEELFTVDPLDVDKKREFLEELGDLLRGEATSRWGGEAGAPIWALFSIREDRIAELQPYLDLIPTSLCFRHRLDALDVDEANEAIRETAGESWMSQEVPQRLVDDLCRVSVRGADGRETLQPGRFVEPVQLQVVCRGLWNKIVARQGRKILGDDVEPHEHSEVDRALREFFDDEVDAAADQAGVSERKLREWIEAELISPSGVRTQVLREPAELGKTDAAIAKLVDAHLLRSDRRAGREWIELPHDRLVAPVLAANREWATSHLKPFQIRARHWREASGGHAQRLLLQADELETAKAFAADHVDDLTDTETDFLEASEEEVRRNIQRRKERKRVTWAIWLGALSVLGVLVAWLWVENSQKAKAQARADISRDLSSVRELESTGAAIQALLDLRPRAADADENGSLPRRVDNALRQQLRQSPAAVMHELQPRNHIVWSLAFTGDGRRLLAGSWDGHVSLQQVDDPSGRAFETPDIQSETYAVALHPASGVVASTHRDGRVLLWRIEGDGLRRLAVLVPDDSRKQLTTADFSDDGRWLAVGGWSKKVNVWDVADPTTPLHKATLVKSQAPIQSITFVAGRDADGGQRLASTDYDGKGYLWSIGDGMPDRPKPVGQFSIFDHAGHDVGISASAADPTGRYFIAGDTEGDVHVWDLASPDKGKRLENANHRGGPQDTHVKTIVFAPDGSEFVSVGLDGYLVRWTMPAGANDIAQWLAVPERSGIGHWQRPPITAQRYRMGERLFSAAYRPGAPGQVVVGGTRNIFLLDLDRGAGPALSAVLPGAQSPLPWMMVSMDAEGTRIAASHRDGAIRFWRREAGALAAAPEWSLTLGKPFAFAVSPDGARVVTVDCRGLPTEWSLGSGAKPARIQSAARADSSTCAKRAATPPAFSPDGRFLATADGNLLRVWARAGRGAGAWRAFASRALLSPVPDTAGEAHADIVSSMAFNADSTLLGVGATSGAVRLWNVERVANDGAFAPIATSDVGQRVVALTFNPDGTTVRAGGDDGFLTECRLPAIEKCTLSRRHERRISGAIYSRPEAPRRPVLLTVDVDGHLVEWSRRQDEPTRISTVDLATKGSPLVNAMALSRDGKFLVTAGEGLYAWDFSREHVLATARAYVKRTYEEPPPRSKSSSP